MAKLIICRGIPASGKSTWAEQQKYAVVVTRDDIRMQFNCTGAGWSKEKELDFVVPEMNYRISEGLKAGLTVISADTNLNPITVARLINLAQSLGAEYEIKDFDTPLEVCIERDSEREYPWKVGEVKIREYYELWEKRNAVSS